jgi:hypothetical protein
MLRMLEDQQEPEWIAALSEQRQDIAKDTQEQTAQADMVEDLREQIIQAEEELGVEKKAPLAQLFLNLEPWQRLLLAVLLFLDVALCGCMALVMTGRVVLPF